MRSRIIAVLLALAGFWCLGQQEGRSQLIGEGVWKKPGGASAPFSGAGDVLATGVQAYWAFRSWTAATKGNKLANVCDSTGGVDVTCVDMSSDATTGYLVVTAPGGVTCVANCTVKILYDISGQTKCSASACDMSNATVATRPVLVPSCLNGNACMSCNGSQFLANNVGYSAQAQPLTVSFAAERTSGASFSDVLSSDSTGTVQSGFSNSASTGLLFAGSVISVSTVPDNAFHAAQMAYNGASSTYNIDGATSTVSPGAGGFPGGANTLSLCATSVLTPSNQLTGRVLEAGYWSGQFSGGQQTSMNSNQHGAYGGF